MNQKRAVKITSIIILIISLSLFAFTLLNYQTLKIKISSGVENYGYAGVGITSFILDGSPQIIGADFPLISGIIIGLDLFYVFLVVIVASALSGIFTYALGYIKGKKIAILFIDEEKYENYVDMFKKKGKFAMTISALTPVPYLPVLAGTLKMHPYDFLLYGVFMRTLRFAAIAYFFFLII